MDEQLQPRSIVCNGQPGFGSSEAEGVLLQLLQQLHQLIGSALHQQCFVRQVIDRLEPAAQQGARAIEFGAAEACGGCSCRLFSQLTRSSSRAMRSSSW